MNVRLVVPSSEEKGLDSRLSQHFGRAPFYVVVDLDEKGNIISDSSIPNTSEHFGGVGVPPDRIIQLKPNGSLEVFMINFLVMRDTMKLGIFTFIFAFLLYLNIRSRS